MCSVLEQPYGHVWELVKFLGSFIKAKLAVRFFTLLLNQIFLNSCFTLANPTVCVDPNAPLRLPQLSCSWRTDLEVHWALTNKLPNGARGSGSRVAEGGWKTCSSVVPSVSQRLLNIFSAHSLSNLWVPHSKINRNRQVSSWWDLGGMGGYLHQPESTCFMQLINTHINSSSISHITWEGKSWSFIWGLLCFVHKYSSKDQID